MKPGFYIIMAAQFFSSLADNALLIAAIALLYQLQAPAWMTPLLKLFFVLSYVVLAAFVGAFADSRPKGRVMFLTNSIKIIGCLTMLFNAHPLLAYAIVGFGAAAYSPAKYGILTFHFYWVGAVPAMIFVGVFMMPFYCGSKARSVPEYLRLRFDEKTRALNALTFAAMTVFSSGISMYALGKLFQLVLS